MFIHIDLFILSFPHIGESPLFEGLLTRQIKPELNSGLD